MRDHLEPAHTQRRQPLAGDNWLITFADLLALLLTFFVLVYSVSGVRPEAWADMVSTLSRTFNPEEPRVSEEPETISPEVTTGRPVGDHLRYLRGLVENQVASAPALADIQTRLEPGRLVIAIPSAMLFEPKSARLQEAAAGMVSRFDSLFRFMHNGLLVAGHTNPLAPGGGSVRTNWELSLHRSRIVAGLLSAGGYPSSISVIGYGASRFTELDPALTEGERYQLAERIEVIVLDEERSAVEYDGLFAP